MNILMYAHMARFCKFDVRHRMTAPAAVVLLSGVLDSTITLYIARADGFACLALTFDYGQLHRRELAAAAAAASELGCEHRVVALDLRAVGGSALTDAAIPVPTGRSDDEIGHGIPVTYVPARNTIFLSYALAVAEVAESRDIFIGANHLDYSGYPDCRPEFLRAFERVANLGTRAGTEAAAAGAGGHRPFRIHAPLLELTKAGIIERGKELGVAFERTLSCYQPDEEGRACGRCDACLLRLRGFAETGLVDPAPYQPGTITPTRA